MPAGSFELAGTELVRDEVLVAEPGADMPALVAGSEGAHLLEHFRTSRALP